MLAMLSSFVKTAFAVALLVGGASGAQAKAEKKDVEATRVAERTGAMLFAYDQAAWHGTDKFMTDVGSSESTSVRGYIVLPEPGGRMRVVFYADKEGILVAFRSYSVAGGRSVRALPAESGVPLDARGLRMVAAREAAQAYVKDNALPLCATAAPNMVVFPPNQNDQVVVYVMTPQTENGRIPMGGHYRFEFDSENRLLSHRKFSEGCRVMKTSMEGLGLAILSHPLDDHPTEIHGFVSRMTPFPITIGVANHDVWIASKGKFEYAGRLKPE
jgi:hypothetical protein